MPSWVACNHTRCSRRPALTAAASGSPVAAMAQRCCARRHGRSAARQLMNEGTPKALAALCTFQRRSSANACRSNQGNSSEPGGSPTDDEACQPTSNRMDSKSSACRTGLRKRSASATRINCSAFARRSRLSSQINSAPGTTVDCADIAWRPPSESAGPRNRKRRFVCRLSMAAARSSTCTCGSAVPLTMSSAHGSAPAWAANTRGARRTPSWVARNTRFSATAPSDNNPKTRRVPEAATSASVGQMRTRSRQNSSLTTCRLSADGAAFAAARRESTWSAVRICNLACSFVSPACFAALEGG